MKKHTRGPSWKEINSLKNVGYENRVIENNKLKKLLNGFGWRHWDHWNILDHGYTIDFIKDRKDLQFSRLHFSWYYDAQFCEFYMIGEMHGFYNYDEPNGVIATPVGTYEISNIFEENIHLLPVMEERMVTALVNQTAL
jgi:hypothetical protein